MDGDSKAGPFEAFVGGGDFIELALLARPFASPFVEFLEFLRLNRPMAELSTLEWLGVPCMQTAG